MSGSKSSKRSFGALIGERALAAVDSGNVEKVARNELSTRGAALSKASGEIIYSQSQWVDPAWCKPSPVNARDYESLTYEDCAELIETIKSEGTQRTPATVRPSGDDRRPYEIVAGLRRHWSISWLRANNYPDFKYLITVQRMDDESAFRFSDIENRARTDITDVERARSYRAALELYYDGDKARMSGRIGITSRNLNRYLQLADLDPIFLDALGGHRHARIKHARDLFSAAKTAGRTNLMKDEAQEIITERAKREGESGPTPAEIVKRLIKAASEPRAPRAGKRSLEIRDAKGQPMIDYVPGTARNALTIKIYPSTAATPNEIKAALSKIVDEMSKNET